MITSLFISILKIIPIFILFLLLKLLLNYAKTNKLYYINYIYLLKYIIFNVLLIIYYILYILIFFIYFILKNFRFFKYYYSNMSTALFYYKKKSIYFLFWRFLVHSLFFTFILFIKCIFYNLNKSFKTLYFINKIYILFIIFFKTKTYFYNNLFIAIYDIYIYYIYNLYNFFNIDEIYNFIKFFNINILNMLTFIKDPILNRNNNFSWFTYLIFYNYTKIKNKKWFDIDIILMLNLFLKSVCGYFIYVIYKLNLLFYVNVNNKNILSYIFLLNKIKTLSVFNYLIKTFKITIYFINLCCVNIVYLILSYIIFLCYFFLSFLMKLKYIIIIFIILLICFKYYWIFYYYFFLLYKHYILYIPLFQVKDSVRFFNFEWIDLRNYFNLIFLHNTLVDLSIFNNIIYNDLLNHLNKTLSVYGFKVGNNYDINLHAMLNIYNQDTILLNNLFCKFNTISSISLWKWYLQLKKLVANKAQMIFKFNKKNYKNSKYYQKPLEKSIRHNSIKQEGLTYLGLNRENLFKHNYKNNFIIWKLYNKNYFKKIAHNFISLNISNIKKIKKIPLKYLYLYNSNKLIKSKKKFLKFYYALKTHFNFIKKTKRYSLYLLRTLYKLYEFNNSIFYFGRIYNYDNYKNKMQMKHKIPNFEWTALRWRRKTPNYLYFNPTHLLTLDEHHKWYSFYELAKKKIKKKRIYKMFYINYKYPFSLNNSKNIIESLNYLKQLDTYIKIIKKYYYIKNTKIYFMKRYYKKLLHANNLVLKTYIYRLKNWNEPFFKKQLSNKNNKINNDLNFWYFFDYFKIDKYYYTKNQDIYKEESDLVLYFIKKTRKDYMKLRNHLLRMYSLFFHYYYLERTFYKHYLPMQQYKKTKASVLLKNKRILWNYESFKLNWMFKLYLTRHRVNRQSFKNVKIISKLFKQHFFAYFIYCDYTINTYNDLYYIKIKSYRLKILNKINNLKRLFYFKNKYVIGSSFFKYINSFSLSYHIKHLLWNSPYSFLFFQENLVPMSININKDINITNLSYYMNIKQQNITIFDILVDYLFQKEYNIIKFNNYSMLFNLFSNIIILNNNWYNINIYAQDSLLYSTLYLSTFFTYYNCGYSIYKPFYIVDVYRFVINFIFDYYTNFLYRLTRYRYILNYKNYTIYDFFKRYFNFETKYNIYFKVRLLAIDLKFINRLYKYILTPKNKYTQNAYKKTFIPFWFIFDYYTKLFIHFLLNKYYIQDYFVYYWITKFKDYFFINFKLIFITIFYYNLQLYIYKKYIFILNLLNIKININKFNINMNINNNYNLYYWYFNLIFQFNIDYFYTLDFMKIKIIYKLLLMWTLSDFSKYNFNKIIFIKLYLEKLIMYYLKIFFNFKNTFIFFKPNYIYYRKQRDPSKFRGVNKMKAYNIIFKNTITYRNINSFKHLTVNISFFKNIYLTNIYNYVYLLNSSNINIEHFINLFFYLFKYNYAYMNVFIYLILCWLIYFFIFIFYKQFYNLFFFCNYENCNYEYNWNKLFKKKVILLSKNFKKKEYKIIKNKNIINFYNFFFTNFFKNLSFINNIKHKILFIKNKQQNGKYWNNNAVIEIPNNFKLIMFPYSFLHKYLFNLFYKIVKMPINLKKENKIYKFHFYDFLNTNLFSFCLFYWLLLIPYFFFEFILMKYHLKGHILIKRRMFLIIKIFLDNFKWFIKLFKIIGDGINIVFKHKHPKTYKGIYVTRNKKKLKFGYFFKWDRMHKQRLHLSPLGTYYYWFFRINKMEYFFSLKNYYFNNVIKSNYFYYIYLYFILLFVFIKKIFYNKYLNFIFINKKK